METDKKPWTRPKLTVFGDVEDMTLVSDGKGHGIFDALNHDAPIGS